MVPARPPDAEIQLDDDAPLPPLLPRPAATARMVSRDVRDIVATAIVSEVRGMVRWRDRWKVLADAAEAVAKGLTGVCSVLAFAASAVRDPRVADWLSFSSGAVGTLGLVLLTYANYASRESKQRTSELNGVLRAVGVTPVPQIATEDEDADRA